MGNQFIVQVLRILSKWFYHKVRELIIVIRDLFIANTKNDKVIEFFIITVFIGSFISFGEKVNEKMKVNFANEINGNEIFSSISNTPQVWKLVNEFVSYYLVSGVILNIVIVFTALLFGAWFSFLCADKNEDKIEFYKKITLRYFYCWLILFVVPNLFFEKSIFLNGHSLLWDFVVFFIVYCIFIFIDYREIKKPTLIWRTTVISLFLLLGNWSVVKLSTDDRLRTRAMYFALSENVKNSDDIASILFSFRHASLIPKDYKKNLYKIAGDLNIRDINENIMMSKVLEHCSKLNQRPIGYNKEPCNELSKDFIKYSNILTQIQNNGIDDVKLLTFFPIEKYFKSLVQ